MRRSLLGMVIIGVTLAGCGSGTPGQTNPSGTSRPLPASPAAASPTLVAAPSTSALPTPSISPSPSSSPRPSVSEIGVVRIPFAGREMQVTLVGAPGVLSASRPATEQELEALRWGEDDIALGSLAKRKLVLGWIGTVCDTTATLAVAEDRLVVSPEPREGCDAMALSRGVVLTFARPVDAAAMVVVLEDTVLRPEPS